MPTRLLLIAHAATPATRRAAFPNDDGLDERGRVAAGSLTGRWPSLDRVLTSPAMAAQETAALIASDGLTPRPALDDGLRDLDTGRWAGRSLAEIGEAGAAWIADPQFAGHGGESLAGLRLRIVEWLAASVRSPGLTMGVTHAAVIRAALLAVLDAPVTAFWNVDAPPLAVLTLGSDGRRWVFRGFELAVSAR